MDKVLIVDGDPHFLNSLKAGLEKVRQFEILTAATGDEAISILGREKVSVFVTDIETPNLDSLDLLAYMTNKCPNTPCIIMTDWGKPWFGERLAQQSFLYHLEKPFEIGALVSAIFVGLNLRDEGSHFKGMTMMSLLPLMELYQKTCRMKVGAADKENGFLYFKDGVLFDAHFGILNGEDAAREISTWQKIAIELSELPRHRTRKRVKTSLMDIAGFSWGKQETDIKLFQPEAPAILKDNQINNPSEKPEKKPIIPENIGKSTFTPQIPEKTISSITETLPVNTKTTMQRTNTVYHATIRRIKKSIPYKAIAIANPEDAIMATDQTDNAIDVILMAKEMTCLFRNAVEFAKTYKGQPPQTLTIHASDAIILIHKITKVHYGELYIIISCPPFTNAHLIRSQLAKLLSGPSAKRSN